MEPPGIFYTAVSSLLGAMVGRGRGRKFLYSKGARREWACRRYSRRLTGGYPAKLTR